MRLKSSDDDGFSSQTPLASTRTLGLARERGERGGVDVGRDDDFDELALDDLFRGRGVERAVERDDAAERRDRIAGIGVLVRLAEIGAERDAARIGVLDDDAGRRLAERLDAFERGVGVGDVVERELLAGEHARGGDGAGRYVALDVERAALVRILAVAQRLLELEREIQRRRERLDALAVGARAEPVRDHAVVARRVRVRLGREPAPQRQRRAAVRERFEDLGVVGRIDDDRDMLVVLRGGAQHRRAADVDVLDRVGERAVRARGRRLERIEVHDQQIDRRDLVLRHHRIVDAAPAEQAAVHLRVQRLDAAVHDFGKAGQRRDVGDRHAALAQRRGAAAGRDQRDAERIESVREIDEAGLVGNAEQGPPDGHQGRIEHGASTGVNRGLYRRFGGGAGIA